MYIGKRIHVRFPIILHAKQRRENDNLGQRKDTA